MWRSKLTQLIGVCSVFATASVYAWQDVDSDEAFVCATTDLNCYILDVRTDSEWIWVGHPGENRNGTDGTALDKPVRKVINVSYLIEFGTQLVQNPLFISEVDKAFGVTIGDDDDDDGNNTGITRNDVTLITMCRSGSRSQAAATALEAAGYTKVFNMINGFEGERDDFGYRTKNGWKVEGYPYNDSSLGAYSPPSDD
ncbi:MAG: rhodanese-like domain-containing protein [Gammaproteobacteria bacterium]|nr:rhodanese-like domain-containing protein [Gammaproteobacteria bacterium]